MIKGLLSVIFGILKWILGLLPKMTFLESVDQAIHVVNQFLYDITPIIPVNDVFICIGLCVAFYNRLLLFKSIMWLVHRLPFIG